MTKKFNGTEKKILDLFKVGDKIKLDNTTYSIAAAGKPKIVRGECKTDVYINLVSTEVEQLTKVYKISIKQENYDFLENKTTIERAKQILGDDASNIIKNALNKIQTEFESVPLIYFSKFGNTQKGSMTIGWKFEFVNKKNGKLSDQIPLTDDQKLEICAGTKLADDKRNALVSGQPIENSGVPEYILEVNVKHIEKYTKEQIIEKLIPISDYAKSLDIFFACKAINFRTEKDKWDGDRPVAMYVDWEVGKDNKIAATLRFDNPLQKKANELGRNLRQTLIQINLNYKKDFGALINHLHPNMLTKIIH